MLTLHFIFRPHVISTIAQNQSAIFSGTTHLHPVLVVVEEHIGFGIFYAN